MYNQIPSVLKFAEKFVMLIQLVEKSVKGMLPKNKLGAALFRNLKVYVGENHKHEGQDPKLINLNDLK